MNLWATKSVSVLRAEAEAGGDRSLRRALGPVNLVALGIGAIIGAGIFVLTGLAAARHAGPAVPLSFVLTGFACAFAGLCYAEMASAVPVAGSAYTYAYVALGELVAEEIHRAGAVAKEFHTIAVDDGIAMGHEGMLYSLPSRELIADAGGEEGEGAEEESLALVDLCAIEAVVAVDVGPAVADLELDRNRRLGRRGGGDEREQEENERSGSHRHSPSLTSGVAANGVTRGSPRDRSCSSDSETA